MNTQQAFIPADEYGKYKQALSLFDMHTVCVPHARLFLFFVFLFNTWFIRCQKFWSPYLSRLQQPKAQLYPLTCPIIVCAVLVIIYRDAMGNICIYCQKESDKLPLLCFDFQLLEGSVTYTIRNTRVRHALVVLKITDHRKESGQEWFVFWAAKL